MVPSELGAFLKESREAQGLTLEEIEARTHIRAKYLAALEVGDWDVLPPGVYTRGLLRSYAKAVGASEKSALRYYLKERPQEAKLPEPQLISQPLVEEPRYSNELLLAVAGFALAGVLMAWLLKTEFAPLLAAATSMLARGPDAALEIATPTVADDQSAGPTSTSLPTPLRVVITGRSTSTPIGAGGTSGPTPIGSQSPQSEAGSPTFGSPGAGTPTATPQPSAVASETPLRSPTPGSGVATSPAGTGTAVPARGTQVAGLRMGVTATGRVWLRVIADGEEVYAGFMQVGEGQSWTARQAVEVRTGNAGGTQVTLNGKVLEPLGDDGVVLSCSWRLLESGTIEQTC